MSKLEEIAKLTDRDILAKYEARTKLVLQKKFSPEKQFQLEEELCYIEREINTRNINTNKQ